MGIFYEKIKAHRVKRYLKKEIEAYRILLEEYNLTLNELTSFSPKETSVRKKAIEVAKIIAENENLAAFLKEKKQLPVQDLNNSITVYQRTIKDHGKYFIAVSLIYAGHFPHLKSYINI